MDKHWQDLTKLAYSPSSVERQIAARDPDLPADLLSHLIADDDPFVRAVAADHPNAGRDDIDSLLNGPDNHHAHVMLAQRRDLTDDQFAVLTLAIPAARVHLGKNPKTPARVLTTLSRDRNATVRVEVAANPTTPAEVLATLADDPNTAVRAALAANPAAPTDMLTALACDATAVVRAGAASHPGLPHASLAELAGDDNLAVAAAWDSARLPATIFTGHALSEIACTRPAAAAVLRDLAERCAAPAVFAAAAPTWEHTLAELITAVGDTIGTGAASQAGTGTIPTNTSPGSRQGENHDG